MAGQHLLLLPGMMCDARMWADQVRDLDVECHVPNLTETKDFSSMARDVLADAPDRFAVAGLSMGGILAFELWRQAPERITHLALLDTNPFADTPETKSVRLDQIRVALEGGLRELAVESLKPLYLAEANRDNVALLQGILDMVLDLGPDVFRDQSMALKNRKDSVELLSIISVPTTVICGVEDTLCPVGYHEYMAARIPGATLKILEDCGHMASMEQPDVVTQELQALLQKQSPKGHSHADKVRPDTHDARR
ncbi:MAG: alpha/beta fold hydrolase [Pseudomonadota bacterium]